MPGAFKLFAHVNSASHTICDDKPIYIFLISYLSWTNTFVEFNKN